MNKRRTNKRHARRAKRARSVWLSFQGRHDPQGDRALEECALCDGEASRCRGCEGVGLVIFRWRNLSGKPMRRVHPHARQVQTSSGYPCEGAFKGWDGRRCTVPRCSE